jgi:hypothetical protein
LPKKYFKVKQLDQFVIMDNPDDGYQSANPSMISLEDPKDIYTETTLPMEQDIGLGPSGHTEGNATFATIAHDNTHEDYNDADSAYDSESLLGDDTRSLASYITDYRYEHGRRYHAYRDGAYWVSFDS